MKKIAFFDTKPYDRLYFDLYKKRFGIDITYFEGKLTADTVSITRGCDGVCAFVNDDINSEVVKVLYENNIKIIAMRCAGYNNVSFREAYGKIHVVRVPAYSPHAVAEHAMALLLTLNRKTHRSYIRTRDFNFSLNGLVGFDLYKKTVGIIGTGKIGRVFAEICKGFGMNTLAYDPYPSPGLDVEYTDIEALCRRSDIISLHCPLTEATRHIINSKTLSLMKNGVYLINTSRGSLIDSEALLEAIKSEKLGAAALDVYEEEGDVFFEDFSGEIMHDDTLSRLISMPNVLVTSHQAFLTREALESIAETTLCSLKDFFEGKPLANEVCYKCQKGEKCRREHNGRCF